MVPILPRTSSAMASAVLCDRFETAWRTAIRWAVTGIPFSRSRLTGSDIFPEFNKVWIKSRKRVIPNFYRYGLTECDRSLPKAVTRRLTAGKQFINQKKRPPAFRRGAFVRTQLFAAVSGTTGPEPELLEQEPELLVLEPGLLEQEQELLVLERWLLPLSWRLRLRLPSRFRRLRLQFP